MYERIGRTLQEDRTCTMTPIKSHCSLELNQIKTILAGHEGMTNRPPYIPLFGQTDNG